MRVGLGAAVLALASAMPAGEFRQLQPIPYPTVRADGALRSVQLPPGAVPVSRAKPVDPKLVTKALSGIVKSWNSPDLKGKLDPAFVNRDRLSDVVRSRVPRDASLRLLSVQSVRTMNQHIEPGKNAGGSVLVSRVAVRAKTQIELRDPTQGFRRGEGTNEYILTIRQKTGSGM